MTLHLIGIRGQLAAHPGTAAGAILAAATLALVLSGCAPGGGMTPAGQQVVDVLCEGDALAQPVVVPVVALASPAAGPAQPAVAAALAADQVLVHPAVVMACAAYHSRPAAVVAVVPPGAVVAAPVAVAVAVKPAV
jgi:hypothetical protein